MWKATIAATPAQNMANDADDDWETDPDFVNDINEEQQRYGKGGKTAGCIDMAKLREETEQVNNTDRKLSLR